MSASVPTELRERLLAAAERFANELADAIEGRPLREDATPRRPLAKTRRRKGIRWPANKPPPVVDDVTAQRAEQALRRAGIVVR